MTIMEIFRSLEEFRGVQFDFFGGEEEWKIWSVHEFFAATERQGRRFFQSTGSGA